MTRPLIALHVGAHKTATTHLQRSLQSNRRALRDVGVAYLPPHHYRKTLADFLRKVTEGQKPADLWDSSEPLVMSAAEGHPRVILTDENILGQLPRIAKEDRIYPWGRYRVATTLAALGRFQAQLFLSVRNPASFVQSAYSESLIHVPYRDFDKFCAPFSTPDLRWSVLVDEIRKRLPDVPLTVWRFEDYPDIRSRVAEELVGQPLPEGFKFIERHPRPGLSARALEQLGKWADDGRDIRDESLIAHAAQLFPKGEDWPAPDYFDAATRARINESYANDCARIDSMPGVTFLRR